MIKCSCGYEDEHWDVIDVLYKDNYETYGGYESRVCRCALKISGYSVKMVACPNCGALRIIK